MPQEHDHAGSAGDILLRIRGTVQGVGFRPFIARLAREQGHRGWVYNDRDGVTIRLACHQQQGRAFAEQVRAAHPPAARIDEIRIENPDTVEDSFPCPPLPGREFHILPSPEGKAAPRVAVTADLALCPDCRGELLDPEDRRHLYPFTNCTNCGPRYTIVRELPYDRARTTMAGFSMCDKCAAEYADPTDRRYHAQPNACPECGPQLSLLAVDGMPTVTGQEALETAVRVLECGDIVAVKGLGGFHLFVDATSEQAVKRLRQRKHRDEKPLAVMFASLEQLRSFAEIGTGEENLLAGPVAPIVLLRKLPRTALAYSVSPQNPWVGAMLPYTPLHLLLMQAINRPLVATSANISEEPLCTDNDEAVRRLKGIADLFLVHDRPIARPVDDSVIRPGARGPIILRRARGYAPAPLPLPDGIQADAPMLCVGGHLKNTISLAMGGQVVTSPHIGDLANAVSIGAFRRTVDLLSSLYGGGIEEVVCDLHPDYASTRYAESLRLPLVRVQHHLAHLMACLLDNNIRSGQVLGVVWDGTGYGEDDTIWGGEFILVDLDHNRARRVGCLRPFSLPGGESAIRNIGRSALGALHEGRLLENATAMDALTRALGQESRHLEQLVKALQRGLNSPRTSSAGRLFDASSALLGIATRNTFEGQAAMAMEFAAARWKDEPVPRYKLNVLQSASSGPLPVLDWAPLLEGILQSIEAGQPVPAMARGFHEALAAGIADVARTFGVGQVALTGGCFQNALLTELTVSALEKSGHRPVLHRELSPNDNGISAGQAYAALLGITRCT